MEAVLNKSKNRKQSFVSDVSIRLQPKALIMEDIEYWQAVSKRLDSSVLDNGITMQEIVDEVNAVRKERYEKQNRI